MNKHNVHNPMHRSDLASTLPRRRVLPQAMGIALLTLLGIGATQAATSVKLKDVIASRIGQGTINLFNTHNPKDVVTGVELEALRIDNKGSLVFGVDVNEAANTGGLEKVTSQAVTVKSVKLTVVINGVTHTYQSTTPTDLNNCCSTETRVESLAEGTSTQRQGPYYTLIGHTGSNSITGDKTLNGIDSTLTVKVPENLSSATSAILDVVLLETNTKLGDPESYYGFSGGFEDLALLNAADAESVTKSSAPARTEAPLVTLTNPPPPPKTATSSTTYVPGASTFYFAGYEDLYPKTGDYDFNDLTVAYQVGEGLDAQGKLTVIHGTAYLITRGAAFSHDWHLKFDLPAGTVGKLTCTLQLSPGGASQPCSTANPAQTNGGVDITVFENTAATFKDPGAPFVNTMPGRPFIQGPKATFILELAAPIAVSNLKPPFNAYLHVRNTGQMIQLLEVNPAFKDVNGFPFGMLMPTDWEPPTERTSLIDAYTGFLDFVTSQGTKSANWFKTPKAEKVFGVPVSSTWAW